MFSGQNDYFSSASCSYPRLVADIGGTYSRFGLQRAKEARISDIQTFHNKDYDSFPAVITTYLTTIDCQPRHAAFAIAGAINGEQITTANISWPFSRLLLQQMFQFDQLLVINDFAALALSLPSLQTNEYRQLGRGTPRSRQPLALIGPGTGLGMSGLIPTPTGQWIPLQGEGGHTTIPAMDTKEAELIRIIRQTHPHVSAERLLCGAGLPNLYQAMATLHGQTAQFLPVQSIIQYALEATCPVCEDVLDTFCAMLGTVAGNLAMTLGAQGGLYLGGGMIPLLGSYFSHSRFRTRFEDKGRLHSFVAEIPTYIIDAAHPALQGAATALSL